MIFFVEEYLRFKQLYFVTLYIIVYLYLLLVDNVLYNITKSGWSKITLSSVWTLLTNSVTSLLKYSVGGSTNI